MLPERGVPDKGFVHTERDCSEHIDEGELDREGPGILRTRCQLGCFHVRDPLAEGSGSEAGGLPWTRLLSSSDNSPSRERCQPP